VVDSEYILVEILLDSGCIRVEILRTE